MSVLFHLAVMGVSSAMAIALIMAAWSAISGRSWW